MNLTFSDEGEREREKERYSRKREEERKAEMEGKATIFPTDYRQGTGESKCG